MLLVEVRMITSTNIFYIIERYTFEASIEQQNHYIKMKENDGLVELRLKKNIYLSNKLGIASSLLINEFGVDVHQKYKFTIDL